ncbi:MAG: hypothetical protein KAS32_21310 [Candidatus Peribacteraceae bacterium]|nr:hypothetical protein [Candidatus Peribacteraceae bacterium]
MKYFDIDDKFKDTDLHIVLHGKNGRSIPAYQWIFNYSIMTTGKPGIQGSSTRHGGSDQSHGGHRVGGSDEIARSRRWGC